MINTEVLMQRWSIFLYRTVYLILVAFAQPSIGGSCWKYIDDRTNLCQTSFGLNMTYEECCVMQGLGSVSWSPQDISGNIFYWNFISKGASTCHRCHKNCTSLLCEQGKTCRMVKGKPICVCKPHCSKTVKSRGALCGTDGRRYRNYCALQRYNCEEEKQIFVEYYGKCRNSCRRVQCEAGKYCLQDQNGVPHCITCYEHCNLLLPDNPAHYMCGENGKTYRNTCELKADICKTGRGISISHSGKCFAHETCKTLTCPRGTTCLVSFVSGKPICMNCNTKCAQMLNVPICGTDRNTYENYCDMVMAGCSSGVFISALRKGPCRRRKRRGHLSNAKLKKRFKNQTNKSDAKIRDMKNAKRLHRTNNNGRRHKKDKLRKRKRKYKRRFRDRKIIKKNRNTP